MTYVHKDFYKSLRFKVVRLLNFLRTGWAEWIPHAGFGAVAAELIQILVLYFGSQFWFCLAAFRWSVHLCSWVGWLGTKGTSCGSSLGSWLGLLGTYLGAGLDGGVSPQPQNIPSAQVLELGLFVSTGVLQMLLESGAVFQCHCHRPGGQ